MICAWNMRGLNKRSRHIEIRASLKKLNVSCIALLETKVKANKVDSIRNKFGQQWRFIDNYDKHSNGRIWIMWKVEDLQITMVKSSDQFIHCDVSDSACMRVCWLTMVDAHNKLLIEDCCGMVLIA